MSLKDYLSSLRKTLKGKLVDPIYDPTYPPEYTARGVFIGLFVALTPTVGMQIPILMLIWPLTKKLFPRWHFNIVVAIAWTLITNVVTLPAFYYLFIVTGRILLGRWDNLQGYEVFESRLPDYEQESLEWYATLFEGMVTVIDKFGLPLLLGSLPWAILGSLWGYFWCLRLIKNKRKENL